MLNLFNEYKNENRIMEALLVGRNMVNKEPDNYEYLKQYLELVLSLAENLQSIDEQKKYLLQADSTLLFFEENANLTKDMVEKISKFRERIAEISTYLIDNENARVASETAAIELENTDLIKKLYSLKQEIINTKVQEEFDRLLNEIRIVDSKIRHEYLTEEQTVHYDQLNRECTECISEKMRELERVKNVEYNREAVNAYDKAFQAFKKDEGKYKNQTQLNSLVSTTLFAYDAARLFNETLIYYNHVYSYIFSKMDDDGKLALTRFSIECERKLR